MVLPPVPARCVRLPDGRRSPGRLADLGFSPDYVAGHREALVLARALVPEIFDSFLTRIEHSLDDPEFTRRTVDVPRQRPTIFRRNPTQHPVLCWTTKIDLSANHGSIDPRGRWRGLGRHRERRERDQLCVDALRWKYQARAKLPVAVQNRGAP